MIGSFKRKQERPENSMTFSNGESSFDITIVKRPLNYYLVDGIKLDNPTNMLENYEDNLELRDNPTDKIKIEALNAIIKVINPDNKLRLELDIDNKKYKFNPEEEPAGKRLRLTHINVNANPEPGSPPNLRKALQLDDL
jgi:hypothetical protein